MWAAISLGLLAAGVAGAADTVRVAGKVTLVSSLCGGGAAVSQEMIARLPPPQPIAGKEILVVGGGEIRATRPAARFVTRGDGSFVTRLPPGTWCFFDAARKPSAPAAGAPGPPVAAPPSANVDAACLEAQKRRCDLVLTVVKRDISKADITFNAGCPQQYNQPCYRGPMPP
jgi:hypothetical protein